jgi:hypothetical protein
LSTNNAATVQFAPKARLLVAPSPATDLPVDVTTALGTAFKELGYVDASGLELTPTLDTTPVEAMQSATPIKYVVKSAAAQLKFTLLQWDDDTVALYFGAALATDATNNVKKLVLASTPALAETAMVVEWGDYTEDATDPMNIEVTGTKNRLVIPRGMVSTKDPIKLSRTDVQSLGVTYDALDVGGQLGYLLTGPTA